MEEQEPGTWQVALRPSWDAHEVVVAIAAAPFLQAMATYFGNRLAGAVDESTRVGVRRFLRLPRWSQQQDPNFELRTEHGWKVRFSTDLPPEALAQLAQVCDSELPEGISDVHGIGIRWSEGKWRMTGTYNFDVSHYWWDADCGRWLND
ncbi:hypothetical protein KVH22_21715 [Streptomyces olivaceus]|uniref:hypothetical protein n=1 Tax=Streptomyces olivaceus TaxID=47716 RepID=UPI001CCA0CBF|nr:hypothetical protein [Streptomyces olivaceus]MBZ6258137.1 hypothetical protein [Streptomyces olivaceus]